MHFMFNASGAPEHTKIELRTRLNTEIDNLQPWSYSSLEWKSLYSPDNQYEKAGAKPVGEICPVYNCHGLTFGSRRTQIDGSPETISMILAEDGFDAIDEKHVKTGDVVVYYDDLGQVLHSGIVLSIEAFGIPKIWSKWGKGFEWVHLLRNCPYAFSRVTYYRLKIWKPEEILKKNSLKL
jgi:hypothetical protein